MLIDEVASHFERVKQIGPNKIMCACPLHADNKASLIISVDPDKKDGKEWVNPYCFAGCDTKELKNLLRDKGFNRFGNTIKRRSIKDPESGDTFIPRLPIKLFKEKRDQLVNEFGWDNVYMYHYITPGATNHEFSHFITRKDIILSDGTKDKEFRPHTLWRDKDTKEYKWQRKGQPKNFLRNPYIVNYGLKHKPKACFIHEGEKAVDRARSLYKDIAHVTWQGGSLAVNKTDWNQIIDFAFETIYLIPDNDDAGRKAMNTVADKLLNSDTEIYYVDTSSMPPRWDFGDIPGPDRPEEKEKMYEKVQKLLVEAQIIEWHPDTETKNNKPEFIYINGMERFMNVESGQFLTEKGYKRKMTPVLKHGRAHEEFFTDPNSILVDKITFDPTKPPGVIKDGSMTLWNSYIPPKDIKRIPGDVTLFLEHLEYLIPDELTKKEVIKRMAHIVQKPHIKIRSILLLFSEAEGVGKTTLFLILRRFLGKKYCKQLNQRQIMGEFNEWAMNCLLIAIEEIAIKGDYSKRTTSMDILKTVISEDTITINIKNEKLFTIPNHINGFAFSNNPRPITLTKLARRYHIIKCDQLAKPPEYYNTLWNWLENEEGFEKLYDFLMGYDISDFNPNAEPPKTVAFFDLVDATQTPLDLELDSLYQSNSWPFTDKSCLISPRHLKDALTRIKINPSINQICDWLGKNGFVNLEKQIEWTNDQKPTVWANGEVDKWKELKPKDLRNFYLQPVVDKDQFYFVDANQMKRVNALANLETLSQYT